MKTFWIIFAAIMIIFMVAILSQHNAPRDGTKTTPWRTNAYYMAKEFMTRRLKAPASAKFAEQENSIIKLINDSVFTVDSYVDAQNSFGAMIRTQYSVKMENRGDQWTLISLATNP